MAPWRCYISPETPRGSPHREHSNRICNRRDETNLHISTEQPFECLSILNLDLRPQRCFVDIVGGALAERSFEVDTKNNGRHLPCSNVGIEASGEYSSSHTGQSRHNQTHGPSTDFNVV